MPVTLQELDRFHRFAVDRIDAGDESSSLQELLDLWSAENPDQEQYADDVMAVKAALRDFDNGDPGLPFDEHLRQLRALIETE